MVVEATYVLCTTAPHNIDEKEARHRDKVLIERYLSILIERYMSAMR